MRRCASVSGSSSTRFWKKEKGVLRITARDGAESMEGSDIFIFLGRLCSFMKLVLSYI